MCPVGCCSAARTTHVASASPPPSGRAPSGSRDALAPFLNNGSLRCPFCISAITTHWHAVGAAGEPARGGGGLLSARQLSGGGASPGHFCARATEARRPQGARSTWGGAKKEQVAGARAPAAGGEAGHSGSARDAARAPAPTAGRGRTIRVRQLTGRLGSYNGASLSGSSDHLACRARACRGAPAAR